MGTDRSIAIDFTLKLRPLVVGMWLRISRMLDVAVANKHHRSCIYGTAMFNWFVSIFAQCDCPRGPRISLLVVLLYIWYRSDQTGNIEPRYRFVNKQETKLWIETAKRVRISTTTYLGLGLGLPVQACSLVLAQKPQERLQFSFIHFGRCVQPLLSTGQEE